MIGVAALIRWATSKATRGTISVGSAEPARSVASSTVSRKDSGAPNRTCTLPRRRDCAEANRTSQLRLSGVLAPPPSSKESASTSCCWS